MLDLSFPAPEVVEAARGRILSMLDGDVSMHPELSLPGLWDIELASCHGSRNVCCEIFADVFPASGGRIPAGGETEVLSLIVSALDGAEEFRAHVECAHAFFRLQQGYPGTYSWEYDWEAELTEAHDRLAQLLKTNWRPWQGLRIKEERPGAYRLIITHALEFDRDITAFLPFILLTKDGLCAAPSAGAMARLVTASLLGKEKFRLQVEQFRSNVVDAS